MEKSSYDFDDTDAFGLFKTNKRAANQYKKTSNTLFKISMFFGVSLLIIFIILKIGSLMGQDSGIYELSNSSIPGSIFSISIILIAVAFIMYFFDYQFSKLEKIIEEVESGEGPIFEETEEEKI